MENYYEHVPTDFWSAHPDGRVSLPEAHDALLRGVDLLGDAQLGLKIGRTLRFGVGGAFDYAVRSAPTVGESIAVAGRYTRLIADSLHFSLDTWRTYSIIRIDFEATAPRAVTDFAMASFFRIHLAEQIPTSAQLTCWFPYPEPADTSEFQRTFQDSRLAFNAPFLGFTLKRGYEAAPMPGADAVLHAAHCDRVATLLASLSASKSTSSLVQRVIERELARGRPTADRVARVLHMSRRTLSRRLALEGTDFSREMENVRRQTALKHVLDPNLQLVQLAFLSGFSHVESFHRAFRRWTGSSPLEYRGAHIRP